MADQIRTTPDWEDIRVFVALARHGSLSAAARALSVSHATISRRIQSLEQALGERLVERRPDGYVLTPAGTRTLGSASEMEAAAAQLGRG
ncbi:LysR family transcriptional regulator, partial [Burkholderia sp. Cy-647]